jgi:hypothetical protein
VSSYFKWQVIIQFVFLSDWYIFLSPVAGVSCGRQLISSCYKVHWFYLLPTLSCAARGADGSERSVGKFSEHYACQFSSTFSCSVMSVVAKVLFLFSFYYRKNTPLFLLMGRLIPLVSGLYLFCVVPLRGVWIRETLLIIVLDWVALSLCRRLQLQVKWIIISHNFSFQKVVIRLKFCLVAGPIYIDYLGAHRNFA